MRLTPRKIADRLRRHPGWTLDGDAIRKQYTFPSFPDAVAFVTRLGFDAQEADHHPDLHVNFKRVTVVWSTHSAGGVTSKDFDGAKQSDMIAARMTA